MPHISTAYTPGVYDGGPIENYLFQELQRISEVITPIADGAIEKRHVVPEKPRFGLFYADGSDWDPGSGEGLYRYDEDTDSFVAIEGGGGGGAWTLETADFTLVAGDQKNIEATTAATTVTATLPGTLVVGDEIKVHNQVTSTEDVFIDPATHTIKGPLGEVASPDDLILALGETAHMVAISTSVMELV